MNTVRQSGLAQGIWSAIPIPWQKDEQLDKAALRRTVDRCIRTGSDGIYVGGTTGEFHAMTNRQLRDVSDTFMDAVRGHPGTGSQVGCGAGSLAQVCERIEIAMAAGCRTIQLPLPAWVTLTDDEVLTFYQAVAERFPDVQICVYDTVKSGREIGAGLWPRLLKSVPAIAGGKITGVDPSLAKVIRQAHPGFVILAAEETWAPMWKHGVHAIASWISFSLPRIVNDLYRALREDDRQGIRDAVALMNTVNTDIKTPLRELGYRRGSMDRLMGMATGFLEPVYERLLLPWRSVRREHVALARETICRRLGKEYLFTETCPPPKPHLTSDNRS